MKVIVAGGRNFTDYRFAYRTLSDLHDIRPFTEVVCGMAKGADSVGRLWAHRHSIVVREFPANWTVHGKSAGYKRNVDMANYADVLVAFWDGESKGTKHMIDIANEKGMDVYVFRY